MVGIDEVGRGAWAGPLLVVAARLKQGKRLPKGLTDSKRLSKKSREELFPQIMATCDIGEGWISADVIDGLGLSDAMKSACMLAAGQLKIERTEQIVIDGSTDYLAGTKYQNVRTVVDGDDNVAIISAASIVAKVLRDQLMAEYARDFPVYRFEAHVGYGTVLHRQAIKKYGITHLHRRSFRPIQQLHST